MWKIIDHYQWENIRERFEWIRDMRQVPQDPEYHAEGDVETHTKMVLEALQSQADYQQLNQQEQHLLNAAVLLHDVEKRSTTFTDIDGRIVSPGHARKGELTSRRLLYREIPTPHIHRETVAKLVRYHGLPLWALEKPDPQKAVIQASLEVNTRHLSLLAKADVLGRICQDREELLYRIALFEELCKENQCFGQAYPAFANGYSRFFYFKKENTLPDFAAYDDTEFEVVMMSALPGSGKDTYIRNNFKGWPVVSLDALRKKLKISPTDTAGNGKVIQEAKEAAKTYMRKRTSFVWNATNLSRQIRSQLIELFTSYKARVRIIYLEVPYATLLSQNRNRIDVVPEPALHRMIRKLEVPSLTEAHTVEYHIREE
ncbi:AAA family ATPase [Rapidithrix thailandica]|uniref:AAA family ATPase n=1 Tax=Rapidithrix thailandica TaxID=413964 RepID=A0AAW9SBE4_9BACT